MCLGDAHMLVSTVSYMLESEMSANKMEGVLFKNAGDPMEKMFYRF